MSINRIGFSLSVVLTVSYIFCLILDFLLPQFSMHEIWGPLLPGFGMSAVGIAIGFVELIAYGWYFSALYVLAYRYFPFGIKDK